MSAIHANLAQIAPLKRYIALSSSSKVYTAAGADALKTIAAGTIFIDMGKNVVLANGAILRKVQLENAGTGDGYTAYIYLTLAPAAQLIAAL